MKSFLSAVLSLTHLQIHFIIHHQNKQVIQSGSQDFSVLLTYLNQTHTVHFFERLTHIVAPQCNCIVFCQKNLCNFPNPSHCYFTSGLK